jgi:hypothetical protein
VILSTFVIYNVLAYILEVGSLVISTGYRFGLVYPTLNLPEFAKAVLKSLAYSKKEQWKATQVPVGARAISPDKQVD